MMKIGSILDGKYEIIKEIGRGGMSVVYLAMDMRTNEPWAIKAVPKTDDGQYDEIAAKSLLAEADLLKKLDHPALPRVAEVFETNTGIYLIMEYFGGSSLDRFLRDYGPQPEALVVDWVKQLAEILSYLHERHIIYRDLKPENVILHFDGHLKLVDFGAAWVLPGETAILGTRGYAAPEQYTKRADIRTDIYALGMTMHYLLTGAAPGRGEPYFPVRQWRPELSEHIETVINRCVHPIPERRYQSCLELLPDLEYDPRENSLQLPTFHTLRFRHFVEDDSFAPKDPSDDLLTKTVFGLFQFYSETNPKTIHQCTDHLELSELNHIYWNDIRHLHILGWEDARLSKKLQTAHLTTGGYFNHSGSWLLIVVEDPRWIQSWISRCGDLLEILNIRHTTVDALELGDLGSLRQLNLSGNGALRHVDGLQRLRFLEALDLSHTALNTVLDLNGCRELTRISIESTDIPEIRLDYPLTNLTHFVGQHSKITDTAFLTHLPSLQQLDLNSCPVTELPPLDHLQNLFSLGLAHTPIRSLGDTELPVSLINLYLGGTRIRRVPESIRKLKNLRNLYLNDLRLDDLPNWLPEIAKFFEMDQEATIPLISNGATVYLYNTHVTGVDMDIFTQPYPMVVQWFENRKRRKGRKVPEDRETPLNEIKVVFLGDGESGKSLTVARLLNDGARPLAFDGNATPGIAIDDRIYKLGKRRVRVHFWDFGGQEILHSMHRMFLTQRTLYVVLLNARDDTQDDRARYWLHNVKSFADGAPVLLVLNKSDQNPNASVNESDLRAAYPGLTEIVRLSALKDSRKAFNDTFTAALKRQISRFETLESPFLPSWNRLKDKLRSMSEPYIRSPQYIRLSEECGVDPDEKIRKALLDWFTDLGVSFCYSGSAKLEDYVILRPDWITNAIYILLYNTIEGIKNGMVSHDAIYRMLCPPANRRNDIKRVLPDVTYSVQDTEYVLNVIRRFRLSYLVQDNVEFIPMLCQRDAMPVAANYAADPNTLEFRMVYEYLPNNVIHRLMVDMHRDLDIENVWLTGARFAQKATGLSAVVKSEGNLLKLFVRSTNLRHPADFYLDIIKEVLEQINLKMGLHILENQVVYKADGIAECFDYDELAGALACGITTCYSKHRKCALQIEDILRQTNHALDADREKLISDLKLACLQMQDNHLYWDVTENDRNTFIRDTLRAMSYCVADQSLSGLSSGGKRPGALDLDIRKEPGIPWTIFEGLNLRGTSTTQLNYWDDHLQKLLDNYNEKGLPFLIQVSYVTCPKAHFPDICSTYSSHMKYFSPGKYTVQSMTAISTGTDKYEANHFLQMRKCIYDCGGCQTTVYHFFVRLGQKNM